MMPPLKRRKNEFYDVYLRLNSSKGLTSRDKGDIQNISKYLIHVGSLYRKDRRGI